MALLGDGGNAFAEFGCRPMTSQEQPRTLTNRAQPFFNLRSLRVSFPWQSHVVRSGAATHTLRGSVVKFSLIKLPACRSSQRRERNLRGWLCGTKRSVYRYKKLSNVTVSGRERTLSILGTRIITSTCGAQRVPSPPPCASTSASTRSLHGSSTAAMASAPKAGRRSQPRPANRRNTHRANIIFSASCTRWICSSRKFEIRFKMASRFLASDGHSSERYA